MRTDRSTPRQAHPALALPPGTLDGPKRAAAALAVFVASSMLAVHLAYSDAGRAAPAAMGAAVASLPAAAASSAGPPAPPAPDAAPPADAPADAGGVPDPEAVLSLGVAPVPAPATPAARERTLAACVERTIRAAGAGEPKPTAPGRWPALKRAREELRQKRLAARAACEAGATL